MNTFVDIKMLCPFHRLVAGKIKWSFIFLVLLGSGMRAQITTGIIKTAANFSNGIVFTADKARQLHLHELTNKTYVDIIHNDSTYRFQKDEIFGYCNGDGTVYRFFENRSYLILNPGEKIVLYKITTGTGMKNSPVTEQYFFSRTADTGILPLTYKSLFSEFEDKHSFLLLLEMYYKNEPDLSAYDAAHNTYKLNRLLEVSATLKTNE